MAFGIHDGATDLFVPIPERSTIDPHLIHTHYFGFSIPEAGIGAWIYIRYQPYFPLCQAGIGIHQGIDGNTEPLGGAYLDYVNTLPWPEVDGNTIRTANGLTIEFLEPGVRARVTYESPDGALKLDTEHVAVGPLLARGHVMPGEDEHHEASPVAPGGTEQFMHCTGTMELRGERHDIDCFAVRDRSWNQVRAEARGSVLAPPVGWSPMYFGDDLSFNQVSYESPDTDPVWKDLFEVDPDRQTHHFAWVVTDGVAKEITRVRRNVHEIHPELFIATKQTIEAVDEDGGTYRFEGEAISGTAMPAWPNTAFRDAVYRWTDDRGRVTHCAYQEIWFETYQRAMKQRFAARPSPA